MKKAFITGATGFLGCNILHKLDAAGWETYALVRKTSNTQYLPQNTQLVEGSLSDYASLENGIPTGVDAVFHVAGNTNMWRKLNDQQYQDNVVGTQNMVNAALAKGAGRFIFTSSVAAFGFQPDKILDETMPSTAENDWMNYNKTKYLAECVVLNSLEKGLDAVVLNPCHIVGKYDTSSWAQLIRMAYLNTLPGIPPGVGMFCYVGDVADAHLAAFEKGRKGEKYLLGGTEASFLDFLNSLQGILGRKPFKKATPLWILHIGLMLSKFKSLFSSAEPDLTPEKFHIVTKSIRCDYSKAIRELDYQTTPIEVMLRESFDWMKAQGMLS